MCQQREWRSAVRIPDQLRAEQLAQIDAEDHAGAAVGSPKPELGVERHDARGQVAEHTFEVCLRGLDLGLRALVGSAHFVKLPGHHVERAREHAKLVAACHGRTLAEVAAGDRRGSLRQNGQGGRQLFRQEDRERERTQQAEQQRQREREPVQLLKPDARQQQLLVVLVADLHGLGGGGEFRRHLLQHLQRADVVGQREGVHRHDHAQVEALFGQRFDRRVRLLRAYLPHHGTHRQLGHHGDAGAGHCQHRAARAEQRRLVDAVLVAQAIQ